MSRAREEYEAQVGGVLSHVWKREGDFLVVDPAEMNTPLTAMLDAEERAGSTRVDQDFTPMEVADLAEASHDELMDEVLRLREQCLDAGLRTQRVFFDFLFADGPDPLSVLERLYLYVSVRSRHHVWGAKDTEISMLFGHSKQNWQHKVERIIEDLVTRFSRSEFIHSGGKSHTARLSYAKQRMGNTSRKGGRRPGEELPPLPAKVREDEPLSSQAKRRAKLMREEAERRELARELGCRPEEIDLRKIDPDWEGPG
jgi:hypothetical protein